MPGPCRAWAWHYYAHEQEKAALFDREWQEGLETSVRHFAGLSDHPAPEDFIRHDRNFYFPNEMLRKVDRMTMASSVEGRAPFAAPAVLALADRLPYRHMVRGGTLKWALRTAFADILPPEVVGRPKHGFNVPIDHWLRGPWADMLDEAFDEGSALHRLGIASKTVASTARAMLANETRLNGHTIFTLIMLNKWLDR
jgi:asparagine synthase (glutamine-hydrolysing)